MAAATDISLEAQQLLQHVSDEEAKTPPQLRRMGLSVQGIAQQHFGPERGRELLEELYDWEYIDFAEAPHALLSAKGRAVAPYRFAEEQPSEDAVRLAKALYAAEQSLPPRQRHGFGLKAVSDALLGHERGAEVLRWLSDYDYCVWETSQGGYGSLTEKCRHLAVRP